jgi:hypothetical protein
MDTPNVFLAKLLAIPGSYVWDVDSEPFHSSYGKAMNASHVAILLLISSDNWHFYGTQLLADVFAPSQASGLSSPASSLPGSVTHTNPSDSTPGDFFAHQPEHASNSKPPASRKVVARVSIHTLRLEREYELCNHIFKSYPEKADNFVRPIELVKLPARQGEHAIAISIFEAPGPNYLRELVAMGVNTSTQKTQDMNDKASSSDLISLSRFLDFAIGASTCLEILHRRNGNVHGEVRGDAFHFNRETGQVKMINFGAGPRSFENGLTAAGWYSLTREVGVENKLRYIAPEQTGRLPAQPDGRTDIYSLGVLFWTLLTVSCACTCVSI